MSTELYEYFRVSVGPDDILLFLFHGEGGDERQLLPLVGEVAWGLGVIAPLGDVEEAGITSFLRLPGMSVPGISMPEARAYDTTDLARGIDKMTRFMNAHIAAERPHTVLGLGYSNGADILTNLVVQNPSLFDAAVLMHPLIPFFPPSFPVVEGGRPTEETARIKTRLLVTAGRNDPVCPFRRTEMFSKALADAGLVLELIWHNGGHDIESVEIDAIRRFFDLYRADDKKEPAG